MECRAICGSLLGGGPRILNLELLNCKSLAQQGLKKSLQVRAVTTESNPARLGRRARREENVEGEFFVDRTCIDCDTCRWMCPVSNLQFTINPPHKMRGYKHCRHC